MEHVKASVDAGVLHIALNRGDKLNAITIAMYEDMTRLLRIAEADEAIGAVLISGSNDLFTSGNDLRDFLQAPPSNEGGGVMDFLHGIARFRKPLGAAVGGIALGIGVTLLFHCDFVVAAENASFSAPFVELGLTPEAGSTYLAPRQIGQKATNRLFLLCETLSAREALNIGLISHVTETDAIGAALKIARAVAARSPLAIARTKGLLRQADLDAMVTQMDREGEIFAELVRSDYCKTLFARFFDKHPAGDG